MILRPFVFWLRFRTGLVVVGGAADVCQDGHECPTAVGDFENVLLDGILDGIGVERFWGCSRIPFGLRTWWRSEGIVKGAVELGDQPGGVGFVVSAFGSLVLVSEAGLGFGVCLPGGW